MDNVYVVRWGPALGDDFSVQVFTEKASMLLFLTELDEAMEKIQRIRTNRSTKPLMEDYEVMTYEVHYVSVNAKPRDVLDENIDKDCSDLICFGEYPNMRIWRNGTEEHQK